MNDLRLFVLRLDPLGGLAHFADDQVVAEAAPYQIIEESLRLLAVGGRAIQSHVFADGAVDQLLFALLFISFVERVFDGLGRKLFAPEVAPQPRSSYRLRRQARVGEISGELLVVQVAQLFESGEDLIDDRLLRPILLHQSRAHLCEAARPVREQIERPLESLLIERLRHDDGIVKRRTAARQAPFSLLYAARRKIFRSVRSVRRVLYGERQRPESRSRDPLIETQVADAPRTVPP